MEILLEGAEKAITELVHSIDMPMVLFLEYKEDAVAHVCEDVSLEGLRRIKKMVEDIIAERLSAYN